MVLLETIVKTVIINPIIKPVKLNSCVKTSIINLKNLIEYASS